MILRNANLSYWDFSSDKLKLSESKYVSNTSLYHYLE